jgi:poly-gamma-glutamate synthesis protein (capsule biosynthesis protein)
MPLGLAGRNLKNQRMAEYKTLRVDERKSKKETTLIAVGDVCLAGRVNEKLRVVDPFGSIRNEMKNSVSIGNLECVVTDKGKCAGTHEILRADPIAVSYLKKFTILSLANNHVLDCGIRGMKDTLDTLRRNGILALGSGETYQQAIRPLIVEINSLRIAFISFVYSFVQDDIPFFSMFQRMRQYDRPGPARYFEKDVFNWIQKLKEKTDYIIASIHWDKEQIDYPAPPQRFLAEKLIDCGVNVIFGHHPHVVQGIQKYRNGLVFYSLGNFLFDPIIMKRARLTKYGLMVKLSLSAESISRYRLIPISTNEDCCVRRLLTKSTEETSFEKHVNDISIPLTYSHSDYYKFWSERVSESYLKACCVAIGAHLKPFFHERMGPYSEKLCTSFIRSLIRLKC